MILKAGKFYDDAGNVVPLEHGNTQQIDLLKRVEELRNEGIFLEQDFYTNKKGDRIVGTCYTWDCLCGSKVRVDIHIRMEGRKYKCPGCGLRFEVRRSEEFEEEMIFLRQKK